MMYIMMNIKSVYFNLSITITEICCIFIKVLFLMNYNLKSSRELYAQKKHQYMLFRYEPISQEHSRILKNKYALKQILIPAKYRLIPTL